LAKTILVVDDEKRLREMLQAYLAQEGFRVVTAGDGQGALFVARHEKPDLIILDLMMPEMGGYEFLRAHSKERDTPVIVLTAKLEENDKVLGLELGAVLRRACDKASEMEILRAADITLDQVGRLVTVGETRVELTPSEFDLLAVLMSAPGRAFSRSDLLDRLQGTTFEGYERTIDVHIRNLRAKIEPDPRQPRYVETVYGIGYRFAACD
jgi:two-component system alkaline phosphatase synthesis response regulator PhoP